MLNDSLAAALSKILNAEKKGKKECIIRPVSKTIKRILEILNEHNYLGTYEDFKDNKGGWLKINLLGNINKCGVIKPRFNMNKDEFEKWEKRYLPAKDFGLILISTSQGVLTHAETKNRGLGGKLLAYCY